VHPPLRSTLPVSVRGMGSYGSSLPGDAVTPGAGAPELVGGGAVERAALGPEPPDPDGDGVPVTGPAEVQPAVRPTAKTVASTEFTSRAGRPMRTLLRRHRLRLGFRTPGKRPP